MASKKGTYIKQAWILLLRSALLIIQLALFVIILFRVVPVPFTYLMLERDVAISYDWVPLEDMSKHVVTAAITSEDPHFNEHYGFDLDAIKKAIEDKRKGKRLRGASTISQQTAKNLFLWPSRSWLRKGLEVPFTLGIELLWNKRRIMEVYLNIIEMGKGIYGVEKASWKYYKKPAKRLNKAESALLVVCFPNPIRWTPHKATKYIRGKQYRIMKWMTGFEAFPAWWFAKKEPKSKNLEPRT